MDEATRTRVRLALFASGSGSNAEVLIQDSFRIESAYTIALMISNNSRAGAMDLALMYGIPTLHISTLTHTDHREYEKAILGALNKYEIEIIALAGYMKRLPDEVIAAYRHRIYNVHPALLPKFGGQGMYGMRVHQSVLESGDPETGVTVHEVEGEYDTGRILAQEKIPVFPNDTPETLAERVRKCEHILYPQVIQCRAEEFQRQNSNNQ